MRQREDVIEVWSCPGCQKMISQDENMGNGICRDCVMWCVVCDWPTIRREGQDEYYICTVCGGLDC